MPNVGPYGAHYGPLRGLFPGSLQGPDAHAINFMTHSWAHFKGASIFKVMGPHMKCSKREEETQHSPRECANIPREDNRPSPGQAHVGDGHSQVSAHFATLGSS